MKNENDRKAYDNLVLDNMDGLNDRIDKLSDRFEKYASDQTSHNLTVEKRMSVVETKAVILGGILGTIGSQIPELMKYLSK